MSEQPTTENQGFFQPWMILLIMPLIGVAATIIILMSDGEENNTSPLDDTSNQGVLLDDATPAPRTLPPRTLPPTATSVFNQPVPQSPLRTLDGESVAIEDYEGKAVIINFWATWCAPCEEEMPALQDFYDNYAGDDIVMLLVTDPFDGQTEADIQAYVERLEINLPIVLSDYGQLNNLLGVSVLPSTYFVDPAGITRGYWIGPIEVDDLQNEVARLLRG